MLTGAHVNTLSLLHVATLILYIFGLDVSNPLSADAAVPCMLTCATLMTSSHSSRPETQGRYVRKVHVGVDDASGAVDVTLSAPAVRTNLDAASSSERRNLR